MSIKSLFPVDPETQVFWTIGDAEQFGGFVAHEPFFLVRAYDLAAQLSIDGTPIGGVFGPDELSGRQIVTSVTLGDLAITRKFYSPGEADDHWLRMLERITNTGEVTTTFTVKLDTNLAGTPSIFRTSSGDASFTVADSWIVTTAEGRPAFLDVLGSESNPPSAVSTTSELFPTSIGSEGIVYEFVVTLAPGESASLLHYQDEGTAGGLFEDAFGFLQPDATALFGLTAAELTNVVNYGPVAAPDGYDVRSGTLFALLPDKGVLGNDTGADATGAVALVSGPAHGVLDLHDDGSFTYVATAGYTGADAFTYQTTVGPFSSSVQTVSFQVGPATPGATQIGDGASNELAGGPGDDLLFGLDGNDELAGGEGLDQLFGGPGLDTVTYAGETRPVTVDLGGQVGFVDGVLADQLNSIEYADGGSGDDELIGDNGSNILNGGDGADVLIGKDGPDFMAGGSAPAGRFNQLFGGADRDEAAYDDLGRSIYADLVAGGAWVLEGGAYVLLDTYDSIESLTGTAAADVLAGDGGENAINGLAGADILYGRGGGDDFTYYATSESSLATGYDTIADFETGLDQVLLVGLGLDPSRILIASDATSTALYADTDPGAAGYELAIAFVGPNAIEIGDVLIL